MALKKVPENLLFQGRDVAHLVAALDRIINEHGYTINQLIDLLASVSGDILVVQTFSATPAFNRALGGVFKITLTANITSSTIINATGRITIILVQDGTGGRTWVPPANLKLSGGAMGLTAIANKADSISAVYDGTNWYETARALNM